MRITKISLENFRNYKKIDVNIDADMVLVLGDNAEGKTNFIESIYYLSNLKSFRVNDNLLLKTGEDYFKIEGEYGNDVLQVITQIKPFVRKVYRSNSQKTTRNNWRAFRTVLFEPSDLEMFAAGPSLRRMFLNQTIVQKSSAYAADLVSLDHILKQRGALIGDIISNQTSESQLDFWDEQLAAVGANISSARNEYVEFLRNGFSDEYHNLTDFDSDFDLNYVSQVETFSSNAWLERIRGRREAELRSGLNLIGPHRDDLALIKDGKPNVSNSSRGETRAQVLALKLLQAKWLSDGLNKPVLLLDDVFSELDETRRSRLIKSLKDHQIFITSTEEHHLPDLASSVLILHVKNGEINK